MARYRLPDVLGGGEIEADESWGGCAGGRPEYTVGEITILMPAGMPMDKVAPPLPPEPPDGAVVLVYGRAVQRIDSQTLTTGGELGRWFKVGRARAYGWSEVCAFQQGDRQILVPDPFADVSLSPSDGRVTFQARGRDGGVLTVIARGVDGPEPTYEVGVLGGGVFASMWLGGREAVRELAAKLWAAAAIEAGAA